MMFLHFHLQLCLCEHLCVHVHVCVGDCVKFECGVLTVVWMLSPRYQSVQCALTQQSSELQDTRMLTEFLERVELEEGSTLGQVCLDVPTTRPSTFNS